MAGNQGGGGGGGGSGPGTMGFLLVIATVCVLIAIVWYAQTEIFSRILYGMKYAEAGLVVHTYGGINWVLNLLHLPTINLGMLGVWYKNFPDFANSEFYSHAKFSHIVFVSGLIGTWMRYPLILILLGFAYFLKFHHPGDMFRRTFTMKKLRASEVQLWPFITPVLGEDLVKTPLDEGPWAMAQTPLDFCRKHKILHTSENKIGEVIWDVNTSEAEAVFAQQMGPLWNGLESQPVHIQAMAVIFVAKLKRDSKTEKGLIAQIARSATKGGRLDMTGVKEKVQEFKQSKPLLWLELRHAYTTTLMASLLEMARSEGVLATAEFLWLKPVDRRMWYVLNSVGRQTATVEAGGPFSHWKTEMKVRRPLKTPSVAQAASALKEAVDRILYVDEDESWRTSSED